MSPSGGRKAYRYVHLQTTIFRLWVAVFCVHSASLFNPCPSAHVPSPRPGTLRSNLGLLPL